MDFNFRSLDNNRYSNSYSSPLSFPASNSNVSFFTHEAIRSGINGGESSRREFFRNPNPNEYREFSIQREIEKERIRAEIMAEERWKRMLEEEVRREMMIERELALRRRVGREFVFGSSSSLSSSMQFESSRVPLLTNFEHPIGVGVGVSQSFRRGGTETLPFQRDPVVSRNGDGNAFSLGVTLKEIKELKSSVPEIDKHKAIILAKPDATDLKRKATNPPTGAAVDPPAGLKKPKVQDEWSCALCRVTATSERALNDHLQGKKHKARENGLNTQRTGFGTGPLPKMSTISTAKPIKVPGATNKQSSREKDEKAGGETSLGKTVNKPAQELPRTDKKITLLQGKEMYSKKENEEAAMPQETPASAKPKKAFNFFCEICQVGTYRLKVMNAHKKGKQHQEKLKKLNKSAEASAVETPALKVIVENKVPDVASTVEKGVVEGSKKLNIVPAVTELNNETSAQNGGVDVKKENKDLDMAAYVDAELAEGKNEEAAMPPKSPAIAKPNKAFKFFCEICQVRTHRLTVLNAHKMGKKHQENVKKLNKSGVAAFVETPALKDIVDNKEQDIATCVEKGVVEENKLNIVVVKELNNETPAQNVIVEVKKETKESDMAASVDSGLAEEKKEMYSVSNEIKNVTDEEVKSSKASADYSVTAVEEVKHKLL